jgi:hypothetical protein
MFFFTTDVTAPLAWILESLGTRTALYARRSKRGGGSQARVCILALKQHFNNAKATHAMSAAISATPAKKVSYRTDFIKA